MQEISRTHIINELIKRHNYKSYLEIGVRKREDNYDLIDCQIKLGIDPDPHSGATHKMTSDDFFKYSKEKFDIIFIDGLHHRDQVKRDIINSLNALKPNGTVVVHDCNPIDEIHQIPEFKPEICLAWCGDVWKAWVDVRRKNGLDMFVIDADWGVGIIRKDKTAKGCKETKTLDWDNFSVNRKKWLNLVNYSNKF